MLVIDEFASLVAELPDFVTGLVGIAQRGRSLGVHLILATQRPAGVVSADIRANTNLRIALRVTDADESSDVIDVRDAAFIAKSTPGRCYVRSGAAAPVAVQSPPIAGWAARLASPADVHIYALDCGTGTLLPLSGLPHCGAVVTRDQTDRVERLLAKLRAETVRRQQLLAAGGFAGVAEQRAHESGEARLPWMLLLMDWWEGFVAAYEQYDYGRLIEGLLQVLREGSAVGLRAVVTT